MVAGSSITDRDICGIIYRSNGLIDFVQPLADNRSRNIDYGRRARRCGPHQSGGDLMSSTRPRLHCASCNTTYLVYPSSTANLIREPTRPRLYRARILQVCRLLVWGLPAVMKHHCINILTFKSPPRRTVASCAISASAYALATNIPALLKTDAAGEHDDQVSLALPRRPPGKVVIRQEKNATNAFLIRFFHTFL